MPIDLTDFSSIPTEEMESIPTPVSQPQSSPVRKVVKPQAIPSDGSLGIDPKLIDPEMQETLTREGRQPESVKKHFWKPNEFEGWDYNEETIAQKRAELGMKDPDEVFKDAKHVE